MDSRPTAPHRATAAIRGLQEGVRRWIRGRFRRDIGRFCAAAKLRAISGNRPTAIQVMGPMFRRNPPATIAANISRDIRPIAVTERRIRTQKKMMPTIRSWMICITSWIFSAVLYTERTGKRSIHHFRKPNRYSNRPSSSPEADSSAIYRQPIPSTRVGSSHPFRVRTASKTTRKAGNKRISPSSAWKRNNWSNARIAPTDRSHVDRQSSHRSGSDRLFLYS